MKRRDISVIIVFIVLVSMITYAISSAIFNSPKAHNLKVEKVDKISGDFPDVKSDPYTKFLNDKALNPTKVISIGDSANDKPFTESSPKPTPKR